VFPLRQVDLIEMSLVTQFQSLVDKSETRLKAHDFQLKDFPKIACELLSDFNWKFNHSEFQEFLCYLGPLPLQKFTRQDFGELPFTLYQHEKFHIDIYIWNNNETSIHDHHFCGAFKVLNGKSLQLSYQYEQVTNIAPDLDWGILKKIDTRYLHQGDVQEIALGDKFIHQVIHMEFPTVTFILRTPDLLDNLYSYWTSGLRVKYNFHQLKLSKVLDYLDCVIEFNKADQDQRFIENLIYPILDQFKVVELVACLQRMRLFVSDPLHKIIQDYAFKSSLAPDFEKIMQSTINEHKMIHKLLFLKHVTRA
jgi:hypothetical protein